MGRSASHLDDDETNDSSSPTDYKIADQKLRSKHSETEQRRRSKINQRFQILRDLIPENDQKRDKASFLLEVIQYIQFLQEKLQVYEGSCQGWSLESTKCLPMGRSCADDCSVPVYSSNGEELKSESDEASISNVYSQGLLNCLKCSLQSSGVDLSQTNISVQLDVGKQTTSNNTNPVFSIKGQENASSLCYRSSINAGKHYEHPPKRLRGDDT
ncbi:transcription factor BIM2-like isoform X4 [Salvia hispanica]|uniref:transcription factor BIM2-like isoform X4 n=1 Tax=Salvia hispanica TaxID=49212 RepID=UPI00200991D9|nr:transcription factor BIM2-like isoform X4 [Salvia hispanica]